jgi:hypothetical protein
MSNEQWKWVEQLQCSRQQDSRLPMPLTADEMIVALETFKAEPGYDENEPQLHAITGGFKTLPDRERVIPAMFSLMERFPNAYLGTPGPLVHSIESVGIDNYEPLLIESVRRQPAELNVWMVNRILNTNLPAAHRHLLLNLMREVPGHPNVPARVAESARRFLDHQAKRNAG